MGHKKIGKMTIDKIFFTHSPDTMTSKNAAISSSCWWMCVKSLIINDMNRCDPILIEIPGKIHSFFLAMVWWAYREVKAQRMCCSFRANSMYRITSPSRCLCMQISANKTLFFFSLTDKFSPDSEKRQKCVSLWLSGQGLQHYMPLWWENAAVRFWSNSLHTFQVMVKSVADALVSSSETSTWTIWACTKITVAG